MNSSHADHGNSKTGRKGDPRMHKAVAARLQNPELTLFEALRIGGFEYPLTEDGSSIDAENVTLSQRKNQLSRRIRLAKKNGGLDAFMDGDDTTVAAAPKNTDGFAVPQNSTHGSKGLRPAKKRDFDQAGLGDDDANPEDMNLLSKMYADEQYARGPRKAKHHPDFSHLVVPPASSVRNSLTSISNSLAATNAAAASANVGGLDSPPASVKPPAAVPTPATADALAAEASAAMNLQAAMAAPLYAAAAFSPFASPLAGAALGMTAFPGAALYPFGAATSLFPQSNALGKPRPSAVAVSSLSNTAQQVGTTLEQLAETLSNTTNLAKVLAECDSNNPSAFARQHEIAMTLYKSEVRALYTKCMILAGIDPALCQESNKVHMQFALDAWQAEGKRLRDILNTKSSGKVADECEDDNEDVHRRLPRRQSSSISDHIKQRTVPPSRASIGTNASVETGTESLDDEARAAAAHDHTHDHGHSHSHDGTLAASEHGQHVHRLEGKCGHKAIIHQPKSGTAHIDFVVGDKIECYDGIGPIGASSKSLWPSKYKCQDLEGTCTNQCGATITANQKDDGQEPQEVRPTRTIPISEINLGDGEWNIDFNGAIDNSVMALFRLGESDEASAPPAEASTVDDPSYLM